MKYHCIALLLTDLILQNFSLGQLPYEFTESLDWEEGLDDATEVRGRRKSIILERIFVGTFKLAKVSCVTSFENQTRI